MSVTMVTMWDRTMFVGERAYHTVERQPGWIFRAAIATFIIALMVPVLLLLFIAFFAAALVFGALAIAHSVMAALRGIKGRVFPSRGLRRQDTDGRQNVRVMGLEENSA